MAAQGAAQEPHEQTCRLARLASPSFRPKFQRSHVRRPRFASAAGNGTGRGYRRRAASDCLSVCSDQKGAVARAEPGAWLVPTPEERAAVRTGAHLSGVLRKNPQGNCALDTELSLVGVTLFPCTARDCVIASGLLVINQFWPSGFILGNKNRSYGRKPKNHSRRRAVE